MEEYEKRKSDHSLFSNFSFPSNQFYGPPNSQPDYNNFLFQRQLHSNPHLPYPNSQMSPLNYLRSNQDIQRDYLTQRSNFIDQYNNLYERSMRNIPEGFYKEDLYSIKKKRKLSEEE